jgi:nifR3 family TIM-barrel protein
MLNMDKEMTALGMCNDRFWEALPRPIVGLAPMDGVTDHPSRHIQKKYGNPDVVYTEFTSVEALCHGDWQSWRNFLYDETQRPIVAQIYGRTPEYFRQVAIMLCELGFDGIDVNMGCPAKTVANGGCGAGLIRTPDCAQSIIQAVKDGVQDWRNGATTAQCTRLLARFSKRVAAIHEQLPPAYRQRRSMPVSVKTRIGYDAPAVNDWVPRLLEAEPAAICLHGRTLRQGYSGLANWEAIAQAAELAGGAQTLILGNGDAATRGDAERRAATYGLAGVLIGRASFGNPFVFHKEQLADDDEDRQARLARRLRLIAIALEHVRLYEETFRPYERYRFYAMRKHLGWYIKDVASASHIRASLMQVNDAREVELLLAQQGYAVHDRGDV